MADATSPPPFPSIQTPPTYQPGDLVWVITATALVFLMCPGLGLFYSGLARAKNALSLMFLTMVSVAVVSIQWFFWGYSLTFSSTGGPFIGDLSHFCGQGIGWLPHPNAPLIPSSAFFIFQLMFAAITPALAFGASAERMRIGPSILFIFIWSTLVYNIITYWVWAPNGWLSVRGVMDYAGGTPVHISSGSAAVAYALVLGKRKDYYNLSATVVPHNVSFVFIGTGLLWFGWYGFNGGSSLAANARGIQTIINTHLAASIGGLVWVLLDYRHDKKLTLIGFCTGAIAGLATITPGSGYVSGLSSLVFGILGSGFCNFCVTWKSKYSFDDALDVFAVHYVGGLVGLLLTGIFAQQSIMALSFPPGSENVPLGGMLDGNFHQILIQLAAIGSVTVWSFVVTFLILYGMNKIPGLKLRLQDHEEEMGTDMAQMGETAYGFLPKGIMMMMGDETSVNLSTISGTQKEKEEDVRGMLLEHDEQVLPNRESRLEQEDRRQGTGILLTSVLTGATTSTVEEGSHWRSSFPCSGDSSSSREESSSSSSSAASSSSPPVLGQVGELSTRQSQEGAGVSV